jgi:hypothetical protein
MVKIKLYTDKEKGMEKTNTCNKRTKVTAGDLSCF